MSPHRTSRSRRPRRRRRRVARPRARRPPRCARPPRAQTFRRRDNLCAHRPAPRAGENRRSASDAARVAGDEDGFLKHGGSAEGCSGDALRGHVALPASSDPVPRQSGDGRAKPRMGRRNGFREPIGDADDDRERVLEGDQLALIDAADDLTASFAGHGDDLVDRLIGTGMLGSLGPGIEALDYWPQSRKSVRQRRRAARLTPQEHHLMRVVTNSPRVGIEAGRASLGDKGSQGLGQIVGHDMLANGLFPSCSSSFQDLRTQAQYRRWNSTRVSSFSRTISTSTRRPPGFNLSAASAKKCDFIEVVR